ncbi:MAG: lipoyl(octanoyl) transferase LipB [Dehalococcoidia bacterium]
MDIGSICKVYDLARLEYGRAWELQKQLVTRSKADGSNHLLLVEHPPVFTLGRGAAPVNLLASTERLRRLGADIYSVDRGGDVTFHGPGQIVAYPIFNLGDRGHDVVHYVRSLEQVVIDTLAEFGITGIRVPGQPGVWLDEQRKICALGVRISRGVTSHGLALNVSTDLGWFDHVVPCGLAGTTATSMAEILPQAPRLEDVGETLVEHFGRHFELDMTRAQPVDAAEDVNGGAQTLGPSPWQGEGGVRLRGGWEGPSSRQTSQTTQTIKQLTGESEMNPASVKQVAA